MKNIGVKDKSLQQHWLWINRETKAWDSTKYQTNEIPIASTPPTLGLHFVSGPKSPDQVRGSLQYRHRLRPC